MITNVIGGDMSQEEINQYIKHIQNKLPHSAIITELTIKLDPTDPEFVDLEYKYDVDVPFERIRRITGYLVSDLSRWNSAKRSEEKDRVKHNIVETM